jgi:general secretion pathway protein L
MKLLSVINALLALWIETVANTISIFVERFATRPSLRLFEQSDGTFRIEGDAKEKPDALHYIRIDDGALSPAFASLVKGKRVELVLQRKRFLCRSLDFPRRATEFLDGIVRAQIDRLTPWRAQDALFGYSRPVEIGNDRIGITIAATARASAQTYLEAIANLGAQSIGISTRLDEFGAPADTIAMIEQARQATIDRSRLRHALAATLLIAVALMALTQTASYFVGGIFDDERNELAQQITKQRTAMRVGRDAQKGQQGAQKSLEKLKHETPSSVLLLEALSAALPDDTYLTELRIDGKKLQIVGLTRNAPALIGLIEHSHHFNQASFFAPTTQASRESRESFHIETQVKPTFTVTP